MWPLVERARAWLTGDKGGDAPPPPQPGVPTLADGIHGVEALEAALGAAWPDPDRTPAAALALGISRGLSGIRAAVWQDASGLSTGRERLARAVAARTPLVVHAVTHGAPGAPATAGQEGLFAALDSGAFALSARNAQEAVDLALVARRVTELALVPGVVVQDPAETAFAPQDLRLPEPALVAELVGAADDEIPCPTTAQRLVFGETRRRLPRTTDGEHPGMVGALQGPAAGTVGHAALSVHGLEPVAALLEEALATVSQRTGRPLAAVELDGPESCRHLLVAHGALAEVASAVAGHFRRTENLDLAVVTVRSLRPLPEARLRALLAGRTSITVLERHHSPLAGGGPLFAALRGLGEAGTTWHAATAGVDGQPTRPVDLALLMHRAVAGVLPPHLFLGLDFAPSGAGATPRREAHLDTLRRAFPEAAKRGLRSEAAEPVSAALVVGVAREGAVPGPVRELARVLHAALDGHLRSHAAPPDAAGVTLDRFTLDPKRPIPAADMPLDVLVATTRGLDPGVARALRPGAVFILAEPPGETPEPRVPPELHRALAWRGARVAIVPLSARPEASFIGALTAALEERFPAEAAERAWVALHGPDTDLEASRTALAAAREALEWLPSPEPGSTPSAGTPHAVRRLDPRGDGSADLPRFWHHVGALYREGRTEALLPDPAAAMGKLPPLSASFHDRTAGRRHLPRWIPAKCEGCGDCWTVCPDGALGPLAITPAALLDAGIAAAGRNGGQAGALKQVGSKIAKAALQAVEAGHADATDALDAAFADVMAKARMPEDRQATLRAAMAQVTDAVGELPVAATEVFLREPEGRQRGSGELFTLVVNPDSCKDCGACAAVCPEDALERTLHTAPHLARSRRLWNLWAELPDTAADTIARVHGRSPDDTLAALTLSRHTVQALGGGDEAEPGSGEKLALRLVLAAAETALQPTLTRWLAELDRDATAREAAGETARAEALRALADRLRGAGGGLGRARAGLVLTTGLAARGLGIHPDNPFALPVVVDSLDGVAGTAEGLALARVQRVAEDLAVAAGASASATWADLDPAARALVPPVIVAGGDELLDLPGLAALIDTGLPVKLVLLSDLDLRGPSDQELRLLAAARGTALVVQTSLSHPGHTARTLVQAITHAGPALVRLYAPSPRRHGFPTSDARARARDAVASGAWPLLVYHPASGGLLGTALDLDGNPDPADGSPDPATWARGEGRYRSLAPAVLAERAAARQRAWEVLQELAGRKNPFVGRVRAEVEAELGAKHAAAVARLEAEHAEALAQALARRDAELTLRLRDSLLRMAGHDPADLVAFRANPAGES